jgi:hypothetical protein
MKKSEKTHQGLYNVGFIGGVRITDQDEPLPSKKLSADTVRNCIDDLRAILRPFPVFFAFRPCLHWREALGH